MRDSRWLSAGEVLALKLLDSQLVDPDGTVTLCGRVLVGTRRLSISRVHLKGTPQLLLLRLRVMLRRRMDDLYRAWRRHSSLGLAALLERGRFDFCILVLR